MALQNFEASLFTFYMINVFGESVPYYFHFFILCLFYWSINTLCSGWIIAKIRIISL